MRVTSFPVVKIDEVVVTAALFPELDAGVVCPVLDGLLNDLDIVPREGVDVDGVGHYFVCPAFIVGGMPLISA